VVDLGSSVYPAAANSRRISVDLANTRNDNPSLAVKRAIVAASEESFGFINMYLSIEPLADLLCFMSALGTFFDTLLESLEAALKK
jgi:hypothetical protein